MKSRITIIESHLKLLQRIVYRFEETRCQMDDTTGFLLVLFFQRFLEHCDSVCKLKESRDHTLIARSILEGGVILKWVIEPDDLDERKKRASRYFLLRNVTFLERLEAQNRKEHAKHKKTVRQHLLSHRDLFDEKDYERLKNGLPISFQQFIQRLTGKSLKKVIEGIKKLDNKIYSGNYSNMAAFHHWNPFYMEYSISKDGLIQYGKSNDHNYEQSLSAAFFILAETAKQLSIHRHLGREAEIIKLGQNLIEQLNKKSKM
jgi:hypothetical protein